MMLLDETKIVYIGNIHI